MSVLYRCEIKQHGSFPQPNCPTCKHKASICNHRAPIKVLCNPLLRLFGWEIASVFTEEGKFVKFMMRLKENE